jgi:hypothetical protein
LLTTLIPPSHIRTLTALFLNPVKAYIHNHRLNAIAFEQHIREFINQRQSSEKKLALSHFLLNHFQIWKDLLHAQQVFEVSLSIIIGSASTWLATELANRLRFAADHNSHHVHAFIRRL